jgi:hypothetical protein
VRGCAAGYRQQDSDPEVLPQILSLVHAFTLYESEGLPERSSTVEP